MTNNKKYFEYFNVDEKYFPCIDESAINSGVSWETTYPHETFISLLNNAEKMLGGTTNKSLWIHGAYGTGKSQCAYALKMILDSDEDKVVSYWNNYEPLRQKENQLLLQKILGHKEQGIVTAYRYASGSISSPQQLFMAIQESVQNAIKCKGLYKGENTLKEGVIAWLEDPINNKMMDDLLKIPKWSSMFTQETANEIIIALKKNSDVSSLMDNIFKLSADRGITALSLTADTLRSWIIDIIEKNKIKIVLIWDEFSDFFRQNKNSLGEFQKIVSICEEKPFYLVVVTHPISSLSSQDDSWKIVQQRFDKVEISLPDNIAFNLIGHAFSVKEAAKSAWSLMTSDLNSSVTDARNAVMKSACIENESVMRNILPIHPMAALVLKNIASAFQSNQRSMFDFIKTPKDLDVKAFQWFIQNTAPVDERPFMTIDMLWDFFYSKGKEYLSSDIKIILDVFPQQNQLNENEKIVLKTILIMQAIDQRLGGTLSVLKPTEQNLSYAFQGDKGELESGCKHIANALVNKGVLILTPIAEGKKVYSAAVLAGDSAKIDKYKAEIREKSRTTEKLVAEAQQLGNLLSLPPALKLRYSVNEMSDLTIVTNTNFISVLNSLKNKDISWRFYAVLALSKSDEESQQFRNLIKNTIKDDSYKNIIVIDALSTPLGLEDYEKYIEYSAMAMYYQHSNIQQSKTDAKNAKDVLELSWKNRIRDGQFIVYTYNNQEGEKVDGYNNVHTVLQTIVLNRYRYIFDFTKGLTETQLKLTQAKNVARMGMGDVEVKGLISNCDRLLLEKFWNIDNYWAIDEFSSSSIVVIKKTIEDFISQAFNSTGKISIGSICELLEYQYGFSPCNISAFLIGFLLKEYKSEPYRYMDSEGHRDSMSADKLAEMIANCIGKSNSKDSYIVNLTDEERAFYELTEKAWSIEENSCSSPSHAGILVQHKMRDLEYPIWVLEEVDKTGIYDIIKKYIQLVQSKGDDAHDIANEIGKIYLQRRTILDQLKSIISVENCKLGMKLFLDRFERGKIWALANEIGIANNVLNDIKDLFNVKYSLLWINSTGEDEICKLINQYEFIKKTNGILNCLNHTLEEVYISWRDTLNFLGISYESLILSRPDLKNMFSLLLKIYNSEEILPDNIKVLIDEFDVHFDELKDIVNNTVSLFGNIYSAYLEGFDDVEIETIKCSITDRMFDLSITKCNSIVKKTAEEFKKNQIKLQLINYWREKTGTKDPKSWSDHYETPILACVPIEQYEDAKKAFDVLNGHTQNESDIVFALEFIKSIDFYDKLDDSNYRDKCFVSSIIKDYSILLLRIDYVRERLRDLSIDVYSWFDNPNVERKVLELANSEYLSGGSDKALEIINSMNDSDLKLWLSEIVKKDISLGVKIINNKRS